MNRSLSRLLYYAFHGLINRDQKIRHYNRLLKTQWLPKSEIDVLQLEALRKLLAHAGAHSPYYCRVFQNASVDPASIRSLAEISAIPLLSKTKLRRHLPEILSTDADPRHVIPNSTSGSTGEKTVFYSDRRAEQIKAPLVRSAYEWAGIRLGDREFRLWGARFDVARSKRARERVFNWLNNRAVVSAYAMDDGSIEAMLRYMNGYRPDYLFSYPSSLVHVCDYLKRSGATAYSPPKGIFTSGEQLDPWQRELIEAHFKTKVYNFYGCREVGIIAQECDRRNGLHVVPENVLIEILDEDGRPVPLGIDGEIVVTDLCNFVMPFIRYRIGDRGRMLEGNCGCGRYGLPRIALEGRTFDIVRSPSGNAVGGTFWTLLLKSRPGIYQFQVIQNQPDSITINYIPENNRSLSDAARDYFSKEIQSRLKDVNIRFNIVNRIHLLESGKRQFVISQKSGKD